MLRLLSPFGVASGRVRRVVNVARGRTSFSRAGYRRKPAATTGGEGKRPAPKKSASGTGAERGGKGKKKEKGEGGGHAKTKKKASTDKAEKKGAAGGGKKQSLKGLGAFKGKRSSTNQQVKAAAFHKKDQRESVHADQIEWDTAVENETLPFNASTIQLVRGSTAKREQLDPMEELLALSRAMADISSHSVDAMQRLAHDTQSTAINLRTVANAQRRLRQQGRGSQEALGPGPLPGVYYDKQTFSAGNRGAPASRDLMDSTAKQLVEIKVVFTRITDIDTVNQIFEADIYIQARWREPHLSSLPEAALASVEFYQCTDPQLKLLNVVGDLEMEKVSMVLRYEPETPSPVLVYMWHVSGIFKERMELQHFPFDVQELSVVLSSELPIASVELTGDFFRASSVNPGALDTVQDWSNYRHVEITRDVSTKEMAGVSRHSVLVVSARVKRRLGFYFWNVIVIVFLIETMTLVFLAVEPTGSTRLSLSVILFFTAVAYKLVVKSTLPPIAYLTYLDVYISFVMAYLFMWAAVNALMCHLARFRDRQRVLEYDEIAQSSLIGLLVLFHLFFIIYIQFTAMSRRRQMRHLDDKYQMAKLMRQGHVNRPPLQTTQPKTTT